MPAKPMLLPRSELESLFNSAPLPEGSTLTEHGLFHQRATKDGKVRDARIGDPMAFVAHFDMPDGSVKVGIAFPNHVGELVLVVVPKSEIYTQVVLTKLADAGWTANTQVALKTRLVEMYSSVARDLPRYTVADRNGMHANNNCFIMDMRHFGANEERRILSPEKHLGLAEAGTHDGWCEEVALPSEHEPFLLMAISAAFAAPIKHLVLNQGAMLNYVGRTSTGKTTAVFVGASVFTDPDAGIRTWDASEPAIDELLVRYNGFLLPIDEIKAGTLNPKQHAAMIHRFGTQRTKQKAAGYGGGVKAEVLALSTEEVEASAKRADTPTGGGAVRFFDIPIGNEPGGIFRTVSTVGEGALLSKTLVSAARRQHGTALPAFMESLFACDWRESIREQFEVVRQCLTHDTHDAITHRGIDVFAAIASAGLFAADKRIVPWKRSSVIDACRVLFDQWQRRNEFLTRIAGQIDPEEMLAIKVGASEARAKIWSEIGSNIATLAELRAIGAKLSPIDPACPPFLYSRGDGEAVCLSTAVFHNIMGHEGQQALTWLKASSLLMLNGNGDGYKVTVAVGPNRETASFIAIRL